jgi:DNA-directed RNA polymerase subunit K/omega
MADIDEDIEEVEEEDETEEAIVNEDILSEESADEYGEEEQEGDVDVEESELPEEIDPEKLKQLIINNEANIKMSTKKSSENDESVEIKIIPEDQDITSNRLTVSEKSSLISIRAAMISKGGKPRIPLTEDMNDPIKIATEELKRHKCPLEIPRMIGTGFMVIKKVNKMDLPDEEPIFS